MPAPKKGPRLGAGPPHQRLMLANLAVSLFEHERIRTTETKARMLRPFAEKLITKAKGGTVHERRQVLSVIEDREVVHKLFAEIAPRFGERNGGYTRILKLGPRNGDGAPMALVELVESAPAAVEEPDEQGRRKRLTRRRKGQTDAAAEESPPRRRRKGEAPAAKAGGETPAEEGRETPPEDLGIGESPPEEPAAEEMPARQEPE